MINKKVMILIPLEVILEIPKLRVTRFSVSMFWIEPTLRQYARYRVQSLLLSSAHRLSMSKPKKASLLYLCFSGTLVESTCSTDDSNWVWQRLHSCCCCPHCTNGCGFLLPSQLLQVRWILREARGCALQYPQVHLQLSLHHRRNSLVKQSWDIGEMFCFSAVPWYV